MENVRNVMFFLCSSNEYYRNKKKLIPLFSVNSSEQSIYSKEAFVYTTEVFSFFKKYWKPKKKS